MIFMEEDKKNGQRLMADSWRHMNQSLYQILIHDTNVRNGRFDDTFTPEKICGNYFFIYYSRNGSS